jgi:hypothetical protein
MSLITPKPILVGLPTTPLNIAVAHTIPTVVPTATIIMCETIHRGGAEVVLLLMLQFWLMLQFLYSF